MLDNFKLDGKTALVTGCKRGIGKAIAIALAEAGADIIGVSSSLEEKGSDVENEIKKLNRKFTAYRSNFSNRKSLNNFIKKLKEENSKIDILINNAGTIFRNPIVDQDDENWDRIININLNSQFILTREVGKEMIKRGNGKIIFIASLLSFQGGINVASYSASKGGIVQLTKALANEWASKGINVNAIAPGYIETDNTLALKSDQIRFKSIAERIPAGNWGKPEDIAGAAVFLCSKASDYIHGTILTVDGGWMGR
ncbi:MAG: SDR family oxidoreductase [Bacteroidetes bacterium]|nr:SDR family oxidoreductase [Bacteroidota bacterium]